jgi:hypothetical protein
MRTGSRRTVVAVAAVLAVGLGALIVLNARERPREPARSEAGTPPAPASPPAPEPDAAPAASSPTAGPAPDASLPADEEPAVQPPDPYEVALRWSTVDLDAVREAMPDNVYWQRSAPTSDQELIRWRQEERERWNREYGKVLSGNATEEEVERYYAHQERISIDSIDFASHLLDHYGDTLPERDVGLLQLAVKLHHARLQEIPRRLAEAQERRQRQDRLREAWLADEEAFEEALRAE